MNSCDIGSSEISLDILIDQIANILIVIFLKLLLSLYNVLLFLLVFL